MSKPVLVFLASLMTSLGVVFPAVASSIEASDWLKRMAISIKSLNYQGSFIYIHDRQIELMHIVHQANAQGEHERLYSLNGAPREIIRDNNLLTCILPDNKSVLVEKSRPRKYIPEALLNISDQVKLHYQFAVVGDDRIAGREAKVVSISPRDHFRYGYRLWLDKTNAMLLKSDVVNERGVVVEQLMFTQLEFPEKIDAQALQARNTSNNFQRFVLNDQSIKAPAQKYWTILQMPIGFQESMHTVHGLPTGGAPVVHLVLSDGLATVSVYIEKSQNTHKSFEGASSMGAMNAFGTTIENHQITVVGEVPRDTVMMIGRSVGRKQ